MFDSVTDFIDENLAGNALVWVALALLVGQFIIRKMIKAALIAGFFLVVLGVGILAALGQN